MYRPEPFWVIRLRSFWTRYMTGTDDELGKQLLVPFKMIVAVVVFYLILKGLS